MKENSIFITDDNGKEIEMMIYFTLPADQNDFGKNFVVVYNDDNEDELYPFIYDEEGNLYAVEEQEELEMIEEVVSAYAEKEEE